METQTRTSGAHAATLGLGSVLVGSLPASLMTDNAPDRYTVEAVFTRRPERDEVAEILGNETREFLATAGYPTVEVRVSDRRLEIAHTNLQELRDGLSTRLADRLAEISDGVHAKQDAAAARSHDRAANEQARVATVAALAESVTFTTSRDTAASAAPGTAGTVAADRAQIDEWTDEGGRGR
ncbi:hypothetical protein [Microbacterium cremeum]|uniref:hypothetical protein n=1 Tax=Microbacterium cremeum TaxID=2782169 RepID=UPI0018891991|nr:hypothetical protein [Microbacterium cremeum]